MNTKENGISNGVHHESFNYICYPHNVGIIGAEFYFPKSYVDQQDLAKFDNVPPEKYNVGLGQFEMGFCHENEDVCSMALSATAALLENYKVDPNKIGFLAVGTETLIDRSKSIKSVLMDLFTSSGNSDIEGADEKNACYGGTQALFHAVDWIYANYVYEKRIAIAVCVDIAIYANGKARCTGGAGAIAFLIAPNAPIVFEQGLRACHSENVYDFYKPLGGPSTEYPNVDGPSSVKTYMNSLDKCYNLFQRKWNKLFGLKQTCSLDKFYAVLFHSPYTRLTQKAFAWLSFVDYKNDLLRDSTNWKKMERYKEMSLNTIFELERKNGLEQTKPRNDNNCFTDKAIKISAKSFDKKLDRYLEFGRRIGNMYTLSLYAQLINVFLTTNHSRELHGQRILLYSYGSGCIAALFSLLFNFSPENINEYTAMRQSAICARRRLDNRLKFTPENFTQILEKRERIIRNGETYTAPKDADRMGPLFPKAFYLQDIDKELRRFYSRAN